MKETTEKITWFFQQINYEENKRERRNLEIKRHTNPMQCVTLFGFQIK